MATSGGGPCPSGSASCIIWVPGTEASPAQPGASRGAQGGLLWQSRGLCGREDEASAGQAPSTAPPPLHTPLTSKSAMFFPSYSFPFSRSVLLMNGLLSLGFPSPGRKERKAETAVRTADQAAPVSFRQPRRPKFSQQPCRPLLWKPPRRSGQSGGWASLPGHITFPDLDPENLNSCLTRKALSKEMA